MGAARLPPALARPAATSMRRACFGAPAALPTEPLRCVLVSYLWKRPAGLTGLLTYPNVPKVPKVCLKLYGLSVRSPEDGRVSFRRAVHRTVDHYCFFFPAYKNLV